jgi:hypothetical protein
MPTWKGDNANSETGNIMKTKSEELDPTAITFTGTINLRVNHPPIIKAP